MPEIAKSLNAPGAPGIPPRWTTSAKDGVGTSISLASTVTFTLSHGILNEIFYPRIDKAATRDMGFLISNGRDFFSEEKRDAQSTTRQTIAGIPAYEIINDCKRGNYTVTKSIITDPSRNTVLQRVHFEVKKKDHYHIYALLAPHLDNEGMGNSGWVGSYKGHSMLFAMHNDVCLAIYCSIPWKKRSVGYVGTSDGWQDIRNHYQMNWQYEKADLGNIALTAEIDWEINENHSFDIAIGFGRNVHEAAHHALSSILEGFEIIYNKYVEGWKEWQGSILSQEYCQTKIDRFFLLSASVIKTHQSKNFAGAMIASLSTPWGDSMGDDDQSGYHLVWPRDMVECAGGLLALGVQEDGLQVLNFLMATQEADGHWSQNLWLDGESYWQGIQLDETALPIILIDLCTQHGACHKDHLIKYWDTVKKAITYLLSRGMITEQDRWEEQNGISVFTISTSIVALLAAAKIAEEIGEAKIAKYCRETADMWYDDIDKWLYAQNSPLSQKMNIEGYYLRINPAAIPAIDLAGKKMKIKNQPENQDEILITEMVSTDPLALVRFGLRDPKDPRMLNTIRVIDAALKKETPSGDCWYRYVNDGYGEDENGNAYKGTGKGRLWPLLTAERAHYELASGNIKRARELMKSVENFANNGLIPEQIWDSADIPDKELFAGKYTGSAMPLVWAHAEYIKLARSIQEQKVFDMPKHAQQRYLKENITSNIALWRIDLPIEEISADKNLRIETIAPAKIRWSVDEWNNLQEVYTIDMGLGIHYFDLSAEKLTGPKIQFTLYWLESEEWTGKDFEIRINPTVSSSS